MIIERSICRSADSHFRASYFSEIILYEESFPEEGMDILKISFREADFFFIVDNIFDSILVIEDHLSFCLCLSFRRGTILDEDLSIEVGVGIAFELR